MHGYDSIKNIWTRDTETKLMVPWSWTDPVFENLYESRWNATEKLDGTSLRIGIDEKGWFYVKGRNDKSQVPPALLQHCATLEEAVRKTFDGPVCLYGEGVGKGIQKHGERFGDPHFVLFDAKINRWWLQQHALEDIAEMMNMPIVPLVHIGATLARLINLMLSDAPQSQVFDGIAEGWVVRPVDGLLFRDGVPIRAKLKERDFGPLRERTHQA